MRGGPFTEYGEPSGSGEVSGLRRYFRSSGYVAKVERHIVMIFHLTLLASRVPVSGEFEFSLVDLKG